MELKIIGPDPQKTSAAQVELVEPSILGMDEKTFIKLAGSILVMIPHRPSAGIHASLGQNIGYWSRFGTAVATVEDQHGGNIDLTRAGMVKAFRDYRLDRPEVRFLVMIDDDEAVPWDAPYRLAAWDRPIVSGVICSYSAKRGIFACFTMVDEYGVARFPSWNFTKFMPSRGLVEANSAGAGLICFRHDVFDSFQEVRETPFFLSEKIRHDAVANGVLRWGEDTYFCKQARELGFKTYVDLSVRGVHYKTIPIEWPLSGLDDDIDPRDWKVDNRDYTHG